MSWSFSMPAVKPEEFDSKLDGSEKPGVCTDEDWSAFKAAAKALAVRHTDEPYIKVSGHGHDPVTGSYPRRSIGLNVNGTETP